MTRRKGVRCSKPVLNYDDFVRKIEDYQFDLRESSFYNTVSKELKNCFKDLDCDCVKEIICYGLGSFTGSIIAKYQLALLLLLKHHFQVDVFLYDPVFSDTELNFLRKLQLAIIADNEEGAREVSFNTLVFMPHCPTALINNLLWRNWSPRLSYCIILGNSFGSLATAQPERHFKADFHYVHSILPNTKEVEIENNFKYTDIFNDMSLHYFPPTQLVDIPKEFWEDSAKPEYKETDVECISSKLKNCKIEGTIKT